MNKRALFIVVMASFALFAYSCTKEERDPCLQPRTTVLHARAMHHADTGSAITDTLLPNPLLFPLTGGIDQYVFGGVKRTQYFTFSLSNIVDSSRWVLRPDSATALQDTLTFYYQRQLHFLSNSCGYTNYYNLQSIKTTTHALDSVLLLRADITTDANVQNLTIIY